MEGMSMSKSAAYGTPLFVVLETHSGKTRSKAVAKTTRVEERNTDPTHPKNHSDISATKRNCRMGFWRSIAASSPG
jgi:hypothetical protein